MPRISEFFGIAIYMYHNDHLPPHFHAIYAEHDASIGIDPVEWLEGSLPRQALARVLGWARQHQAELQANWEAAQASRPLQRIPPLD